MFKKIIITATLPKDSTQNVIDVKQNQGNTANKRIKTNLKADGRDVGTFSKCTIAYGKELKSP